MIRMNELKRERLLCGLKQRELAERAGCTELDISKYETGRKKPSPEMKKRIEEVFIKMRNNN